MNILINRSDAIGDTILTMPMAELIKESFPSAKVYFLISPQCQDLFTHHPYVDGLVFLNSKVSKSPFWEQLLFFKGEFLRLKIDHYFYVGGNQLPTLVAKWLQLPFRGGSIKSLWGLLLNKGLRQKRSRVDQHEAEYNLQLLTSLGIQFHFSQREKVSPGIKLQQKEIENSLKNLRELFLLQSLQWRDQYFVIHPGMSGHTLNWSSRNYGRLILEIEKKYPDRYAFVISSTPSDQRYLVGAKQVLSEEAGDSLKQRICFFSGEELGLRNYMGVLNQAKTFVGPSTGPLHLANALGVPLLGLYSPIKVQSVLRWGPYHRQRAKVIVPDVVCGETFQCAGKVCPYYECMGKVEVIKVLKAFLELEREEKEKGK